ncbi:hypothetical protein GGX14DRAFT_401001 [Mycena pura]|uniref:Uncharacterized protein n=1 Tax=Mycena pura TaxID=153505 RepID=A0AAD6V143_9AGAR|nr:hypothetical protein GGX14DRAFT_401001 [Mycena pura]
MWASKAVSLHHGHVHLGALYSLGPDDRRNPYVPMVELLHLPMTPDPDISVETWCNVDGVRNIVLESFGMDEENSARWTRIDLHRLHDSEVVSRFKSHHNDKSNLIVHEYFLATAIWYKVTVWYPTNDVGLCGTFMTDSPTEDLYLFLFNPCVDIQDGVISVEIPSLKDAYYWSLQSDGREPLSAEVVDKIMPPEVLLEAHIAGRYWSEQDYHLIREITRAKGLDPGSSELSVQLGYPLAVIHDAPLPLYADTNVPELDTFQPCSLLCGVWCDFTYVGRIGILTISPVSESLSSTSTSGMLVPQNVTTISFNDLARNAPVVGRGAYMTRIDHSHGCELPVLVMDAALRSLKYCAAQPTTIDHVEVLRFYVIWAYLGFQKDLPRSWSLLDGAPKGSAAPGSHVFHIGKRRGHILHLPRPPFIAAAAVARLPVPTTAPPTACGRPPLRRACAARCPPRARRLPPSVAAPPPPPATTAARFPSPACAARCPPPCARPPARRIQPPAPSAVPAVDRIRLV